MGPFNPWNMNPMAQPYGGAMPDALAYLRGWGQQQPQPQNQPQNQPQSDNGLVWIRGEEMAKSYPYPAQPDTRFVLMDMDSNLFYIKARGANGETLPMRTYEYFERKPEGGLNAEGFVTREEFDKKIGELFAMFPAQSQNGG